MTDESKKFLLELLNTNSPSGYEMQASQLFANELRPYCEVEIDVLYNTVAMINPNADTRILIDAHIDEIGLQITHIDNDGYLYFRRIGGLDAAVMPGSEVIILGGKNEVHGIIGKKPVHLQRQEDFKRVLALDELWIDIGVDSCKKAKELVSIGDPATVKPNVQFHGDNRIVSKALDNKIGVFVLSEVMKKLSKEELSIGVFGVASSQEEVGCKGIKVQANKINPKYAICIDVGLASDMPNISEKEVSKFCLGLGPGISHSTDNNPLFVRKIKEIAIANNIQFQDVVPTTATGGTNTSSIQLSNDGVVTCLLKVPNRYMHTPVEVCDLRDVENLISLIVNIVNSLNSDN